jgi:hypothetical protein
MNPNSQSTPTAANVGQPSQMVESRGVEPLPERPPDCSASAPLIQETTAASAGASQESVVPRCGDTVRHGPTGDLWEVAYAHGDSLAWCGWPDGRARLGDCEIVTRCTDEEHLAAVSRWLDREHRADERGCHDSRVGWVRRLYRPEEERRILLELLRREVGALASQVGKHDPPLAAAMNAFARGCP